MIKPKIRIKKLKNYISNDGIFYRIAWIIKIDNEDVIVGDTLEEVIELYRAIKSAPPEKFFRSSSK